MHILDLFHGCFTQGCHQLLEDQWDTRFILYLICGSKIYRYVHPFYQVFLFFKGKKNKLPLFKIEVTFTQFLLFVFFLSSSGT